MDIQNKKDIQLFVDCFYDKVNVDNLLGPIFNERAAIDWAEHKPKLYDFWNSILFQSGEYKGRPFPVHLALGKLHDYEFFRWIKLFTETIDECFKGVVAEKAKLSAKNIANTLMFKLNVAHEGTLKIIE